MAVVNVSEICEAERVEPVAVYDYKDCRKRRDRQSLCSLAGHVQEKLLAEDGRASFHIKPKLLVVSVLSELTDGLYELGSG